MNKLFSAFKQYVIDSRNEFRKVVWPSQDEVASGVKVVVISIILFSLFLGLVDLLLIKFISFVF